MATNIVIFAVKGWEVREFLAAIEDDGVLALSVGPDTVRMVTHYGIDRSDIERTLEGVRKAMAKHADAGEPAG